MFAKVDWCKKVAIYDSYKLRRFRKQFLDQPPKQNLKLLAILIKKDYATRYQRSYLGVWWSLVNPTVTALVLYFVFHTTYSSKFTNSISFGPYILSGTLILTFLSVGVVTTTQNLQNSSLIFTRLPAPPEMFAFSSAVVLSLNLLLGLIPLYLWNLVSGGKFSVSILELPILVFLGSLYVTGLALIFFNLVVRFGDAINLIVLTSMLMTYLTPIFYPIESLSIRAQMILNINPLTHFVNIFRKLALNYGFSSTNDWIFCFLFSFIIFAAGVRIHNSLWKRTVILL